MNKSIGYIFAFSLGAAAGVAVSWRILKKKYEHIANEEIASVKEYFSKRAAVNEQTQPEKNEESEEKDDSEPSDEDVTSYTRLARKYGDISPERKEEKDMPPYVIPPEEFGEKDYPMVSLTYYSDGVLADGLDQPVDDVEGTVGVESLSHFGEYEDDSVFVRNDDLGIDYEILRDPEPYHNGVGDN